MLRFLPTIFPPASTPCPAAGTLVEVSTLWASIAQAVGTASLPAFLLPQKLPEQAVELGEHALVGPLGEVAVGGVPVGEVVRGQRRWTPVRSTCKIASMMSRRSCSGGRPKPGALPRRSKRHAARTGSINSQRTSDRSLGYGRRFALLPASRCESSTPRRTAMATEAHDREGRTFWDETDSRRFLSHPSPHPDLSPQPRPQPLPYRDPLTSRIALYAGRADENDL